MVGPTRHRDAFGRLRDTPLTDEEMAAQGIKDRRYRQAMDKSEKDGGRTLAQVAGEDAKARREKRR